MHVAFNQRAQIHTAANLIKTIWQVDAEFGKFDFPFTQVDNVAAVADLGQQHPDWKQGTFEEPKSLQRSRKSFFLQNRIIDNSNQFLACYVVSAFHAPNGFR